MDINLPPINVDVEADQTGVQIGADVGTPQSGGGTIDVDIPKSPHSISTPG